MTILYVHPLLPAAVSGSVVVNVMLTCGMRLASTYQTFPIYPIIIW